MELVCQGCNAPFEAPRRRKTCGERCKKRLQRGAKVVTLPPRPVGLVEATRRELDDAEMLGSSLGQQALALAARIEGPSADTGSSVAALSKELRTVMESALANKVPASDPIDELRQRRDAKRNAG